MSKIKALTVSLVCALAASPRSYGVTYNEASTAITSYNSHDLASGGTTGKPNPETAYSTAATTYQSLDLLTGTLLVGGPSGPSGSTTTGISESDIYKIYIASPAQFSASTTSLAGGRNGFDTQLYLLNLSGLAIATSDDYSTTGTNGPLSGPSSVLPQGSLLYANLQPGFYLLEISGAGTYAADSAGRDLFPNAASGNDPTQLYGPKPAEAASPISSYDGFSNQGGTYGIALTGVVFSVPEPSVTACLLAAGVLVAARRRHRRRAGALD